MCVVYTAFQIVGAFIAATLFRWVRPEEFNGEAKTLQAKLLAELIGTFFLTLTVGML